MPLSKNINVNFWQHKNFHNNPQIVVLRNKSQIHEQIIDQYSVISTIK